VDALHDVLRTAVARHLVSDVPVGVFLSGGIDSPLVAAEACRHVGGELPAFTIGVLDRDMDESEDARRYAQELGLVHLVHRVDPRAAIKRLDDVIDACSEPSADFSIIPTMMLSELARTRVKVALSGDGGDELFWGYPGRFGSAIEQARYFARPRLARFGDIAVRRYLGRGRATREVLWPTVGRLYQKKHTILPERDLTSAFPELLPVPPELALFEFDGTDADETAQWVRWNEFRLHLACVLLKVDRASMYHSLEVRVPLLDKDVIAVATRLDWTSCLSLEQRVGKLPLRELLRRRVGQQTRAKRGFTVPLHEWLAGPLNTLLQERVLGRSHFFGLEVNQRHLERMHRRLIGGDRSVAWGLWLLLSLGMWEDRYWNRRLAREAA
jgi:asparagine synthase (glutamine-hydrolysing)